MAVIIFHSVVSGWILNFVKQNNNLAMLCLPLVVMDDLNVICTDGSRGSMMNINAGTLCAAQYTVDDAWYRARVTQEVGPDSYEVLFVDYGNTEVVSKER